MIKIILLGDSAVGKSKLVERFLVRATRRCARRAAPRFNTYRRARPHRPAPRR